jgi:hypothetical protein
MTALTALLSVFLRAFPRNKKFDSWVLSDWEFFGFLKFGFPPSAERGGEKAGTN